MQCVLAQIQASDRLSLRTGCLRRKPCKPNTAIAARPKSTSIGGAGTSAPDVVEPVVVVEPFEVVLVVLVETLPVVVVVLVETLPVDVVVLVDELPLVVDVVLVETLPLVVETLPEVVVVVVVPPPLLELLELELVELELDVELLVLEPVLPVVVRSMLILPPELPPTNPPPKKPPPKPPPQPPDPPPMTTGSPPPAGPAGDEIGMGGRYGTGASAMA